MPRQSLKRILYVGLEAPPEKDGEERIHLPLIRIVPRPVSDPSVIEFYRILPKYTHAVFTSKTAVRLFFDYLPHFGYSHGDLRSMQMAAVGKATAGSLEKRGVSPTYVADQETAEGLCHTLANKIGPKDYVCWPHSVLSRDVMTAFFKERQCKFRACPFYETHFNHPLEYPVLDELDEIVFTSPSTVRSFLALYGAIPRHKKLTALGPVTEKELFLLRD